MKFLNFETSRKIHLSCSSNSLHNNNKLLLVNLHHISAAFKIPGLFRFHSPANRFDFKTGLTTDFNRYNYTTPDPPTITFVIYVTIIEN